MATYYSPKHYIENLANTDIFAYRGPMGRNSGESVTVFETVTIPANYVSGDILNLFRIPKGAQLKEFIYSNTDLGTTSTTDFRVGTTVAVNDVALGTATAAGAGALTGPQLAASWAGNASAPVEVNLLFETISGFAAGTFTYMATYAMPGSS